MAQYSQSIPLNSLWEANRKLLNSIKGATQEFRENQGRTIHVHDNWKWILNAGFSISLNKFDAILLLTNPSYGPNFHMEAASLSRNLWEIWVTLGWLGIEVEKKKSERIKAFINESYMNQNQINRNFSKRSDSPFSEDQLWIQEKVKEMQKCSSEESQKFPNVFRRMEEIQRIDHRFRGDAEIIYTIAYKEFSAAVHFSIRTIYEYGFLVEDSIVSNPPYELGRTCLDVSGGFFIYIAELWNNDFQCIPESSFQEWQNEWSKVQSQSRKG